MINEMIHSMVIEKSVNILDIRSGSCKGYSAIDCPSCHEYHYVPKDSLADFDSTITQLKQFYVVTKKQAHQLRMILIDQRISLGSYLENVFPSDRIAQERMKRGLNELYQGTHVTSKKLKRFMSPDSPAFVFSLVLVKNLVFAPMKREPDYIIPPHVVPADLLIEFHKCGRKVRYGTVQEAEKGRSQNHHKATIYSVYRCGYCAGFHYGRTSVKPADGLALKRGLFWYETEPVKANRFIHRILTEG